VPERVNCPVTTATRDPDPIQAWRVPLPQQERIAHDHSRSDHGKARHDQHLDQTTPLGAQRRQEVVMKRSSQRRARRWVIQELTRRLDQHHDRLLYQTRSIDGRIDALRVRAANNA
jgi:hypothetical protein